MDPCWRHRHRREPPPQCRASRARSLPADPHHSPRSRQGLAQFLRYLPDVDEITPEPAWIALLKAITCLKPRRLTQHPSSTASRRCFPIKRCSLPRWRSASSRSGAKTSATLRPEFRALHPELVDLAITLHRLGDEAREVGLELFGQLVKIQAYTARETLEQIDNRFRSRVPKRQRLRRRSRRARRQTTTNAQQ